MRYAFLLILIPFAEHSLAQEYVPVPANDARWKIVWFASPCGGQICGYYEFIATGDTVINTQTYGKISLYQRGYFEPEAFGYYYGAIRNDPESKKVYAVRAGEYEEELLYDFNLTEGDTTYVNGDTAVVSSVDSVEIENNYRYIYNLTSLLSVSEENFILDYSIIEGVGSSNGLFFGPGYSNVNFLSYVLTCLSVNNLNVYPVGAYDCTSILQDPDDPDQILFLFPNPAYDILNVTTDRQDLYYEIFNLTGKRISSGKAGPPIKLPELKEGLYFIKFFDRDLQNMFIRTFIIKYTL